MKVRIIYFLFGALAAALLSAVYFTKIIKSQTFTTSLLYNQNLSLYKGAYSDRAETMIKVNNIHALKILEGEQVESKTAQALINSSMILNDMTLQNINIQSELFFVLVKYHKEKDTSGNIAAPVTELKQYCDQYFSVLNCSESVIKELWLTI